MDKIVELIKVNKHYGNDHVLKDVNFDLIKGEIHCLIGQNGCGKSTMIKTISGVIDIDEGSVIKINDKQIRLDKTRQIAIDSGIRVIYQDLSLFPNLTVAENIAFDMHINKNIKGVDWKKIYAVAQDVLDKMHVKLNLSALVEELSIADRQLVAIARALATDAKLIIMDEPTSSLTRKEVDALFTIIKNLQKKGMTIMFVSHKLDEIIEIAERITIMRDGVVINTCVNENIDEVKLSEYISGEQIEYKQHFSEHSNEEVFRVDNLCCYGDYQNISFSLKKGEVLGIIGQLGAGRTEFAHSIFGMNMIERGKIYLHGKEVVIRNNKDAIKNKIAYVPEDRLLQGLVLNQNIENNTIITVIKKLINKIGLLNEQENEKLVEKWVQKLNIKSAKSIKEAKTLSGGNQQKVVIAKWLLTEPEVFILDQPTNGIDIAAKSTIYELIRELSKKGMSIIIISDEEPEIYYNCERALVMHKGRIIKELDCKNISIDKFSQEVRNAE